MQKTIKYTITLNKNIKKDGHVMFDNDIVKDLNRKSFLESEHEKALSKIEELKSQRDMAIEALETITEDWCKGEFGDYDDQMYHCNYCSGIVHYWEQRDKMNHDLDCPILVAKDILTPKGNQK